MEKEKTIQLLSALANGVDPLSGEVFPADSPYNNVEVSRALFNAVDVLKNFKPKSEKNLPANSHQPWNCEQENELTNAFLNGASVKELSELFQRSKFAIEARLAKLRLTDRYGNRIAFPANKKTKSL